MTIKLTVKNYRCFHERKPLELTLRRGFSGFVGQNNAGKSSIFKFLYELRELFKSLMSGRQIEMLGTFITYEPTKPIHILDPVEIFCINSPRNIEIQLEVLEDDAEGNIKLPPSSFRITIQKPTPELSAPTASLRFSIDGKPVDRADFRTPTANFAAVWGQYSRALKDLSETFYIGPFRNALRIGTDESYYDIKVGTAFLKTWWALKSGNLKKNSASAQKVEADIERVFGYKNLQINSSEDGGSFNIIIDRNTFRAEEIGSGLIQFILTLGSLAARQPSYILIDEPELNLHPSLQVEFLEVLHSYTRGGVLFATHNIGLARAASDWVYSVRRGEYGSEVEPLEGTPRLSEFLGELSFSGYRELGFNKVLLVEGPSDLHTIRQFLRRHNKDHQFVLLPLGGSAVINGAATSLLEEVKRISANVFAIIDSEKNSAEENLSNERKAFVKCCEAAGVRCHVLEMRATENYFTDRAIKQAKGDRYRQLGPYENFNTLTPRWNKEGNWEIAQVMEDQEIAQTDLGKFLSEI